MAPKAPSAVCESEIPSLALRTTWFKPRIWLSIREAIAIPAASSLALLTRKPEDKRCNEVCKAPCDEFKLRCAFSDGRFVLIYEGILVLLLTQLNNLGWFSRYH